LRPRLASHLAWALTCALATGFAAQSLTAQAPLTVPNGIPAWAFNIPDKIQPPGVRPEGTVRVPGSAKEYDAATIAGNANPPDWFPDEHLPAPRSVKGDTGIAFACGSCHLMSGQGHPESADLAGMPAEYLIRQMDIARQLFDLQYGSSAGKAAAVMKRAVASLSEDDIIAISAYLGSLSPE